MLSNVHKKGLIKMPYIIKNIKTTVIKSPMLSFLLVLCLVTATLVMLYSYGAFQNYTVEKHTEELKANPDESFIIEFEGGTTMGELRQALSMLSPDTCESLVGFDEYFYSDLSRLDIYPEKLDEYRKKYIENYSDEEGFDADSVTDEDVKKATAHFHRAVGDKVTADAMSVYTDLKGIPLFNGYSH